LLVQRRAQQGEGFGSWTEEHRELRGRREVAHLRIAKGDACSRLFGDRLPEEPLGGGRALQPLHRQVHDGRGLPAQSGRTAWIVGLERLQQLRVQRALAPVLPQLRRQMGLRLEAHRLDPRRSRRPERQQPLPGVLGAVHVIEDEVHLHRPDLGDLLEVDPARAARQSLGAPEQHGRLGVAAVLRRAQVIRERGGRVDLPGDLVLPGEPPMATRHSLDGT
jgi:hypothetical protein